jgi:hypothetical protein
MRGVRYEAIITCGPPHTVHVAGSRLAARSGLPHVADLRDPWRLVERLADSIDSPVWHAFARWYEPAVVARASLVVMNTAPARDAMRQRYPHAADRVIAVMNGFDAEPAPPVLPETRFIVAYTGSIYLDRDPGPLFTAVRQLIDRHRLTPQQLGVVFVGHVSHTSAGPTRQLAEQAGISEYVELLPARPRGDLPRILARAAVLISLGQDSHMAIPSKVFEYMQFKAWLLAMAEPHSATAQLLKGTHADVVSGSDVAKLAEVLENRWQCFARGERPAALASNVQFSRRYQAGLLLDRLETFTAAKTVDGTMSHSLIEARPA